MAYTKTGTIAERFDERYSPEPMSGCWIWLGACSRGNVGKIKGSNKTHLASRVSWMLHKGDIPDGLCVCHKCDNPICVNPDHLFLGTHRDNMQDMARKGRSGYHNAKINIDIATEIRAKHVRGLEKSLAREYGVSPATIFNVVADKVWRQPN